MHAAESRAIHAAESGWGPFRRPFGRPFRRPWGGTAPQDNEEMRARDAAENMQKGREGTVPRHGLASYLHAPVPQLLGGNC